MKLLLRPLILFLSAMISGPFARSEESELPVVKVISQSGSSVGKGSGWLVRKGKDFFVITSEHVVAPLGSGRHEIRWRGTGAPAELMFADWGRGLAVLRVAKPPVGAVATDVSAWDNSSTLRVGSRVNVAGFPFAQDQQPLVSGGEISLLQSQRSFVTFTPGVEITQTYGEYGMSGGPAFLDGRRDADSFVGILSHQVLKVIANQPSRIAPLDATETARHLFLIPRETALTVFREALSGRPRGLLVRRSGFGAPLEIQAGRLIFREARAGTSKGSGNIGGDGGHIGGDGGHIGGDGGHIGGDSAAPSSLRVEVSFNASTPKETWPFPASEVWAEQWEKSLLSRKTVVISSLVQRNEETGQLRSLPLRNVSEFFRVLATGEAIPVLSVPESRGPTDVDKKAQEMRQTMRETTLKICGDLLATDTLCLQVQELLAMSGQSNVTLVNRQAFDQVLDPRGIYKTSWQSFYARDFDQAMDFMRKLNEFGDLIGRR